MVYFTNRELKILRLMTQKSEGVSINELMHSLDVSKRTVYRELSLLEDTAERLDLKLEKDGKLHRLRGSQEAFQNLLHHLNKPLPIEWVDVEKRQIALLSAIALQVEETFSTATLAEQFDVSTTTIQQDISRLNDILTKYNIQIERTEEQTLFVSGSEVYIRLYLSQILSNEINEFDLFQVLGNNELESVETESQYLLSLVDASILRMVYQAVENEQPEMLSKISDEILLNLLLLVTISLVRLEQNHKINHLHSIDHNQLFPYMQQILSIVKVFDTTYKELLNTTELSFFAMQMRGVNVRKNHSIFQKTYDMELGFNIKYLIQLVSSEFHINFNKDSVLYHDLINHIGAALKRLEMNLPEIENTVLVKLKQQYPKLYSIVEEKLIEVFSPAIFSEQEIGYVVTHFASSFEKHGYSRDLKILVVCASGIGTSKILKTRLERSIPEINHIDVLRAVDLTEVDVDQYEIIFSTIALSGFNYDYTLINPILDDKEIETIKHRLSQYPRMEKIKTDAIHPLKPTVSFSKIKNLIKLADQVIADFEVIEIAEEFDSVPDYIDSYFNEDKELQVKLKKRLQNSPLAIPDSGIMLLHTTDEQYEQPVLKLHHLKHPLEAMGMDRQPTQVDCIIVMLGAETMDELTTEFLGKISSSIIEEEDYMKIYQTGTTADIQKLFEYLSVEIIEQLLK